MSDDTTTRDEHSSVIESPEIFSPVFANGAVAEIREAAKSPSFKRLLRLANERLAPVGQPLPE
jgi:hypothetical protein